MKLKNIYFSKTWLYFVIPIEKRENDYLCLTWQGSFICSEEENLIELNVEIQEYCKKSKDFEKWFTKNCPIFLQ